jgi:protein phosphatase
MIALFEANERLLEASANDSRLHGMGAAAVALLVDRRYDCIAVCHVGDARAYRVRGETTEQLTEDHTVVQQLVKEGKLAPEEVATSPHRHILTQALGIGRLVRPGLRLERPQAGDVYALCSDGIHDLVTAAEIGDVVRAEPDLDLACARLIDLANQRGGHDNSTVLLVACDDPAGGAGAG